MRSGWTRVTLRTTPTRSFSIRTAWTAEIPALNVPVSNLFNPFLGYPNQNKLGDYITVVSDNAAPTLLTRNI
jgi:hypothetical protein